MNRDNDLPEGAGIFVIGPFVGGLMWGTLIWLLLAVAGYGAERKVEIPKGVTVGIGNYSDSEYLEIGTTNTRVWAECSKIVKRLDDGSRPDFWTQYCGCVDHTKKIVWIALNACDVKQTRAHENCHIFTTDRVWCARRFPARS